MLIENIADAPGMDVKGKKKLEEQKKKEAKDLKLAKKLFDAKQLKVSMGMAHGYIGGCVQQQKILVCLLRLGPRGRCCFHCGCVLIHTYGG